MRRFVFIILLVASVLAASAGFVWYFGYRLDPEPLTRSVVGGLDGPVEITWHAANSAAIDATSITDAYAGLGYAQGTTNPWSLVLLRQTALGRLGEWFGGEAVEVDIAAKMLGFASGAKEAVGASTAESRSILDAFSSGVNSALASRETLRQENLILLRIDRVEPWEPWHSVAIERLLAWIATTVEVDTSITVESAPTDLVRLLEASARMKDWLALDGFANSSAWALRRNDETFLFSRFVYGSSIQSYVQEFVARVNGLVSMSGAAFVGTPFSFAGQSEKEAFAVLPHQTAVTYPTDRSDADVARSRIEFTDGSEQLISFQRTDRALFFPTDSTNGILLDWPGLRPTSDADSWLRLHLDGSPPFSLLDGTIILVSRAGVWTVTGPQSATRKLNGGVFVSHSPWSRFPADRLAAWVESDASIDPSAIRKDFHSTWAARVLPQLLDFAHGQTGDQEYDEAIEYLRNWDYAFSATSIAGAIFDSWATQVWLTTGVTPGLATNAIVDSATAVSALRSAVDRLTESFGPDQSTWRWERIQANTRQWPLWAMMRRRSETMASTRFAPLRTTGSGHPSSLAWGATSYAGPGYPPGHWESWTSTADWRWTYSLDTNLLDESRFRRTDAPLSTTITTSLPAFDDDARRTLLTPAQR